MTNAGLTIAQAALASGLSTHTLRYYERTGLTLQDIARDGAGHRIYREPDLQWIAMLTRLRATGMPIRDIRRYTELCRAGPGNETERLALLHHHQAQIQLHLSQITAHAQAIDEKIQIYTEHLLGQVT